MRTIQINLDETLLERKIKMLPSIKKIFSVDKCLTYTTCFKTFTIFLKLKL